MVSGPSERVRGGRSEGGAAVGFRPWGGPVEDELRGLLFGGFTRTSSSLLIVYHRNTAEAENVWRWLTLLKNAGGGL